MHSYRHLFHAGNPADVLKHLVLVEILGYLCGREEPFAYIDTHAGAGVYRLTTPLAGKPGEFENGICRLLAAGEPELQPYLEIVRHFNAYGDLHCYPGSPKIAAQLLRQQDQAWLFELHPDEFANLQRELQNNSQFHLVQEDGFDGLNRVLPPVSKRGCILIDPSYEDSRDFGRAVEYLIAAYQRFSTGNYILWYPVVERWQVERMEHDLLSSDVGQIQRFELQHATSHYSGMWASGLFVVNPPSLLIERMQGVLPLLAERLGEDGAFGFRCETLVR